MDSNQHRARFDLALDALNASPTRTSKNRPQSAVNEPTRLSMPFQAMGSVLNQNNVGLCCL
jgi:hypothetical protein